MKKLKKLRDVLGCILIWTGFAIPSFADENAEKIPTSHLILEKAWRLDGAKGRFDASGIERGTKGELLIVRDVELAIYTVSFQEGSDLATLSLHKQYSTQKANHHLGAKRFDIEGLAMDDEKILHACDEYERRVLRFPKPNLIEQIQIDLSEASAFFNSRNRNASFEGIAIGEGRLYLANERSQGRLFEFDLKTGKMIRSFVCRPQSPLPDVHYSGLDWHEGKLFALLREDRSIVEINPRTQKIDRIFRYDRIEHSPKHRYRTIIPFSGVMEALLVEGNLIWLLTDNNGQSRISDSSDTRPTLFRCRIPE